MEAYRELLGALREEVHACYGDSLVSVAVFGSLARQAATPDSDIDVLIVAEGLPVGRVRRVDAFAAVEEKLGPRLMSLQNKGYNCSLSPVLKTPQEVEMGSPLFWDMTCSVLLLFDRNDFLNNYLGRLRDRLSRLGARRIVEGDRWYWDLKPDYKPGDIFEL